MPLFGWTELTLTDDMQRYLAVTGALQTAEIRYKVRHVSRQASGFNLRAKTGSAFVDGSRTVMYHIDVKKQDAERAAEILRTL